MNFTINAGGWIGIVLVLVSGFGAAILAGNPQAAGKAMISGIIIIGGLGNFIWSQSVAKKK